MNDLVKIVIVVLVASVIGGYIGGLVGSNQPENEKDPGETRLGGTRFPNGISADGTTPLKGEVRGTTQTITGESNLSTLIQGGGSFATTTNDAGTFTAAQICDNSIIVATPDVGAVTLTFPTTAQLVADCLPTVGDFKVIRLQNATTTTGAASILTLANGANGDHQEGEGGTTVVEGLEWAEITFMNIDGTNHLMDVRVTQPAD